MGDRIMGFLGDLMVGTAVAIGGIWMAISFGQYTGAW